MASPCLEFGHRDPAAVYGDRPAAFGVAEQDGRVAVVRVSKAGAAPWYDLPGGAVDEGETEDEAVVREFGEETGLVVRPGATLDRAVQYFRSTRDEPYRNHGPIMMVDVLGQNPALKIEADHELVWLEPERALRLLRHDSHAWGLACWLRRRG